MTEEQKIEQFKKSDLWATIKDSLKKQDSEAKKIGFNVSKHWNNMLKTVKK